MRLSVLAMIFALLLSDAAQAMEIRQYDRMSDDDQDEYVADLVVGTEHVLDAASRHQESVKVHDLFTKIKSGDKISAGMGEFAILLAKARVADELRIEKDPNARPLEVEDAMALTLRKNGIEVPDAFFTAVNNFRPKLPLKQ